MGRRIELGARGEGRRLVRRRRRRAVSRLTWLLAPIPVGAGIVVGVWQAAGDVAGQRLREGTALLGVLLVVGLLRLVRGGRR